MITNYSNFVAHERSRNVEKYDRTEQNSLKTL